MASRSGQIFEQTPPRHAHHHQRRSFSFPNRRIFQEIPLTELQCCSQLQQYFSHGAIDTMELEWNDGQPIYRQLRGRVVAMILDGLLQEGDPCPRSAPLPPKTASTRSPFSRATRSWSTRASLKAGAAAACSSPPEPATSFSRPNARSFSPTMAAPAGHHPPPRSNCQRSSQHRTQLTRRAQVIDHPSEPPASTKCYGSSVAAQQHRPQRRRGPHPRPDWPQRRRQNHVAQRHPRPHLVQGTLFCPRPRSLDAARPAHERRSLRG